MDLKRQNQTVYIRVLIAEIFINSQNISPTFGSC